MTDKLVLDPDLLKPSDMERAETALANILKGRDPMDLTDPTTAKDFREWFTFMNWCFRSRKRPKMTWADAQDIEFGAASVPQRWIDGPVVEPSPNGSDPARDPVDKPAKVS
jgi:hypothetical protein